MVVSNILPCLIKRRWNIIGIGKDRVEFTALKIKNKTNQHIYRNNVKRNTLPSSEIRKTNIIQSPYFFSMNISMFVKKINGKEIMPEYIALFIDWLFPSSELFQTDKIALINNYKKPNCQHVSNASRISSNDACFCSSLYISSYYTENMQ